MLVLIGFLLLMISRGIECDFIEAETKLRQSLFNDYDKEIRPSSRTVVEINSITLLDMRYDDQNNIIDLYCWTSMKWTDGRLSWNSTEYGNLTSIRIPANKIWLPDITAYTHTSPDYIWNSAEVLTVISDNGEVIWIPSVHFQVVCIGNITLWPYDMHKCKVKLGSWTHSGWEISLEIPKEDIIDLSSYQSSSLSDGRKIYSSEWNITSVEAKRNTIYYQCCPEPYIDIMIHLWISRNSPSYVVMVQVPFFCLSLLPLVMFLLPPTSEKKITFGGILLLLNMILMVYTSNVIGYKASTTTPLMMKLLSIQLQFQVLIVVISALVVRLSSKPHRHQFPKRFSRALNRMTYFMCLPHYYKQMEQDDDTGTKTSSSNAPNYPNTDGPSSVPLTSYPPAAYPALGETYPQPVFHSSAPSSPYISNTRNPVNFSHPTTPEQATSSLSDEKKNCSSDWILLAAVIDRIALFLYPIMIIILRYKYSSA